MKKTEKLSQEMMEQLISKIQTSSLEYSELDEYINRHLRLNQFSITVPPRNPNNSRIFAGHHNRYGDALIPGTKPGYSYNFETLCFSDYPKCRTIEDLVSKAEENGLYLLLPDAVSLVKNSISPSHYYGVKLLFPFMNGTVLDVVEKRTITGMHQTDERIEYTQAHGTKFLNSSIKKSHRPDLLIGVFSKKEVIPAESDVLIIDVLKILAPKLEKLIQAEYPDEKFEISDLLQKINESPFDKINKFYQNEESLKSFGNEIITSIKKSKEYVPSYHCGGGGIH